MGLGACLSIIVVLDDGTTTSRCREREPFRIRAGQVQAEQAGPLQVEWIGVAKAGQQRGLLEQVLYNGRDR